MNKLFKKQLELQLALAPSEPTCTGELCNSIKDIAFFLNQEVTELTEEIAGSRDINKPWKVRYKIVYDAPIIITSKVKSEAIDVLKFAMNICLKAGITPENINEEFMKVHKVNVQRIDDGY